MNADAPPPELVRGAAVAGTWYPGAPAALARAVDQHLAAASVPIARLDPLVALIVPHAGLVYSGPVAAYAYRLVQGRGPCAVVIIGPSHYVGFRGLSIFPKGAFETPLGRLPIDEALAEAMIAASPLIHFHSAAHEREHSIEMQLPFLQRVLPQGSTLVPLLMGYQTAEAVDAAVNGLAAIGADRRVLLVASSDLSHYYPASLAGKLDAVVIEAVEQCDPDRLWLALERQPDHACGGGPIVAVMRAARARGARRAHILRYADSGDVSGDKAAVVGYLAAAMSAASDG